MAYTLPELDNYRYGAQNINDGKKDHRNRNDLFNYKRVRHGA
jgi:hypothetical protein